MAVEIGIEARDRVSQTLDNITKSVDGLLEALNSMQGASINTGGAMGSSFGGVRKNLATLGKGFQTVGGAMTKYITKPAVGAATGLAGISLAKGFSRMKDMDEARAKLAAMGIEGEKFQKVYDSANASVKGTAFAMNEAMTTAASASAAGIKGNDMQDYLTAISNTAAVAGTSFGEMGMVFNKVAANGKVTAEEWNMMTDRGVDIAGALQKELGVSRDELLKMRQAGEISSDTFVKAMGNMYDGAAKSIGQSTISGAISNINASISRIGANFLGDSSNAESFAGKVLPLLNSLMGALGKVEEGAAKLGEKFGEFAGPYMDKVTTFFNGIADGSVKIDGAKAKMAAIAGVATTLLGPALTIAGKGMMFFAEHGGQISKIAGVFKKIGPNILRIGGPVALIAAGIMSMWQNSESFRNAASSLFSTLWTSLQTVATAIGPIFQSLLGIIGPVMGAIGDLLAPLISVMATVFEGMASKITTVAAVITPVVAAIAGAVGRAAAKIQAMGGAWNAIKSGTKKLMAKVSEKAKAVLEAIKKAWDAIVSAVKKLTVNVLGGAGGILSGIKSAWDKIKSGTKTLRVNTIKKTTTSGGGGGSDDNNATGTRAWKGGYTMVGERGPELVNLPKGASVHTARETSQIMGGNNVVVNMTNYLAPEGKSVDEIISEFTQKLEAAVSANAEGAMI